MKALLAILISILIADNARAACNVDNNGYVKCPAGYCTTRSGPDAFVLNAAQQAITTANLCPGAAIYVVGTKQFPGGYATFEYNFEVNGSGAAVFQYLEIDNDQTLPKGDPTWATLGAWFNNFGVPTQVVWGHVTRQF